MDCYSLTKTGYAQRPLLDVICERVTEAKGTTIVVAIVFPMGKLQANIGKQTTEISQTEHRTRAVNGVTSCDYRLIWGTNSGR